MNTIYRNIVTATLIAGSATAGLWAQKSVKDSTINRQVNVEREYTPTLQDASKINTLPAHYEPVKKQYEIKFEHTSPKLQIPTYSIADNGSGDIGTQIDYSKHRGYAILGGGSNFNFEGAAGYRIIDNTDNSLDLFGTHNSTSGNIKYLQAGADPDKIKAKNMENFIKALYNQNLSSASWYLGASFLNNNFNYYGYRPYFVTKNQAEKQSVNIFGFETGVKSVDYGEWIYTADLKYKYFNVQHGNQGYDGPNGHIIDLLADIAKTIEGGKHAGMEIGILHQTAGNKKVSGVDELNNQFTAMTVARLKPYFFFDGGDLLLSLGLSLNYAFDKHDKVAIAPFVKLDWNFANNTLLYLKADGGIDNNNFVNTFIENRYINPTTHINPSRTLYDAQLGVKSGAIRNFEFDVFAGYKQMKDEHLYYAYMLDYYMLETTIVSPTAISNVSNALYANLKTGHLGGSLKTTLIPYTDLTFKAVAYSYSVDKYTDTTNTTSVPSQKKAWGLPSFSLGANADFAFIDKLILGFDYQLQTGRKTFSSDQILNMKNVSELNLKASYKIMDWISIYGKVNNVLNQKYEKFYGYTLQGINVLAGVSMKF